MKNFFQKITRDKQKTLTILFILCLFSISLYYRVKGLSINHPFWVDEYATADQAITILKIGLNSFFHSANYIEHHNITTHLLVAIFFKMFGPSEFIARLPFAIIGAMVPVFIFILTRSMINTRTAIAASLLTSFSYFQITWSRQARGYVLLQLLILLTLYLYCKVRDKKSINVKDFFYISTLVLLGMATHSFYVLCILAIAIDFMSHNYKQITYYVKNPLFYLSLICIGAFLYISGSFHIALLTFQTILTSRINNVWYYHSFLWREYSLLTFLAFVGLGIGLTRSFKKFSSIMLYIFIHLAFISFFFPPYVSRYILPIFPIMLLLVAYTFTSMADLFIEKSVIDSKKQILLQLCIPIGLVLFILINGNKFVLKPKIFYSVNHDFREIALIDYNQVYSIIRSEVNSSKEHVAVIDTWPGRPYWYLGQDYQPLYIFRWKEKGVFGGGQRVSRTPFVINENGDKIVPQNKGLRLIEDLQDLKKTIKQFPKGFIFIDDSSLPIEVITYAEKNLKKEIYLDHYPVDDNPYSIWPATLYSWGVQ